MLDDMIIAFIIYTYLVWGFAFSIHAMLIMCGVESAIRWAKRWYSPKAFIIETYIFYPMILIGYLFLELIPKALGITQEFVRFDIPGMINRAFHDELARE